MNISKKDLYLPTLTFTARQHFVVTIDVSVYRFIDKYHMDIGN